MPEEVAEREEIVKPRRAFNFLNLLSGVLLILTLLVCLGALLLLINPYLPYNPYPPPTATATPLPTATPTGTLRPPTRTPTAPPATPTRVETPSLAASATLPPTQLPAANMQFELSVSATRQYLEGRTCEDIGFGGQVLDADGKALVGYTIRISRPDGFERTALSGSQAAYGESGWEVMLTGQPVHLTYTIQLLDPGGVAVSPPHDEITSNNCNESLIVIDFRQAP